MPVVEEVDVDREDGCVEPEGVAEEVWVDVREAGVVEPRNVQTSSGPRGIYV